MTIKAPNLTTTRCLLCGGTTHTFTQPALMPGRADTTMVRCDDPRCDLTLDSRDLADFDPALYRFTAALVDGVIARGGQHG